MGEPTQVAFCDADADAGACQVCAWSSLDNVEAMLRCGVIHGDLGFSIKSGAPVLDLIVERIPATLMLMVTAFVRRTLLFT